MRWKIKINSINDIKINNECFYTRFDGTLKLFESYMEALRFVRKAKSANVDYTILEHKGDKNGMGTISCTA